MYIMSSAIVNSYNIYVDSDRLRSPDSTGENLRLELGNTPILCADNQYLRLSLQSFSMYKTWTNVNQHNNVFKIKAPQDISGRQINLNQTFAVKQGDYHNTHHLATAFAESVKAAFATYTGVTTAATNVKPVYGVLVSERHISFDVTFNPPVACYLGTHPIVIGFPTALGDAYALLGGNRDNQFVQGSTSVQPAIKVTESGGVLSFKCPYPAQLSTERNVYLLTDLATTNIQTSSYTAENRDTSVGDNIMSSRILGIASQAVQADNTKEVVFETNTNNEYFVNLQDRSLVELRLYLTDSKGRNLPSGLAPNTLADAQTTLGNRNFEAVLKIDVVQ